MLVHLVSVLAFCSVVTSWKGEAFTFWWQSSLGMKKEMSIRPIFSLCWFLTLQSARWVSQTQMIFFCQKKYVLCIVSNHNIL